MTSIPSQPTGMPYPGPATPVAQTPGTLLPRVPQAFRELSESVDAPSTGDPLKEAFQDFVGQTLFGSMLQQMRKTTGKPAYMHGGQAEEIFQKQMDQHIIEDLSDASAASISDPMFELFNMQRRQ